MLPEITLFTKDEGLDRRVSAYLSTISQMIRLTSSDELLRRVRADSPSLHIIDLCCPGGSELIQKIKSKSQQALIVAIGPARSDPILEADILGVYSTEEAEMDRRHFQWMIRRAIEHMDLIEENNDLREELTASASMAQLSQFLGTHTASRDMYHLRQFTRAFTNSRNKQILGELLIEGVTNSIPVSRIGIFCFSKDTGYYELCAEHKCLPRTDELMYTETDALVEYLSTSPHIIGQQTLNHISGPQARRMLRQNLDVFGAEVIVPLQAESELLGWLFLGPKVTGQQFTDDDLSNLMILGELVSALLANSLIHEQSLIQQELFSALIDSISFGIMAISDDERVRFVNAKAVGALGIGMQSLLNNPLGRLGRLSATIKAALHDDLPPAPLNWRNAETGKSYTVLVQRLERDGRVLGAMALIRGEEDSAAIETAPSDGSIVAEHTALSKSISHEIKNQLVAISTFIQLLPERYDDPEFREHFCEIATDEIARIKELISNGSEETPIDN